MIIGCTAVAIAVTLGWAAARCPLGRAIALGMNCLALASRDRCGALD